MSAGARLDVVADIAERNGWTLLPIFRPVLVRETIHSQREGMRWVSGWTMNHDEPLAGERAVLWWLKTQDRRSPDDAHRLTRLYWRVRDDGGCHPSRPFALEEVAAGMRYDVQPHQAIFKAMARATWCRVCWHEPMASARRVCLWCESAGWDAS